MDALGTGFPTREPITITVPCSIGSRRAGTHRVTIDTDWSVTTPHDLELERIASAFGSTTSCLRLVDQIAPAVADLWLAQTRRVGPGIRRASDGRWRISQPISACACREGLSWPGPDKAAEHFRSPTHWAARHGARARDVRSLIRRIETELGTQFEAFEPPEPGCRAIHSPQDFEWLWRMNLSPGRATELHQHLGLRDPLAAIGYLHIEGWQIDPAWLSDFAAHSAEAVLWAANTLIEHDLRHADDIHELYLAGIHWKAINALAGGPYQLSDIRAVAEATGQSNRAVAATLAAWLGVDCRPSVAQVISVWRAQPYGRQVPSNAAIEAVYAKADPRRQLLERTDVGALLAAIGTPTQTAGVIAQGVRSLAEYEQEKAS